MAYTKATKERRYPPAKPSSDEIKAKKDLSQEGYEARTYQPEYEVDLDYFNVHNLVNNLISQYNQKNDSGVIRNWLKRNKIDSQRHLNESLLDYVQKIREQSDNILDFKAHLMSHKQALQYLIQSKIEAAQFEVEAQREQQKTFKAQQEAERRRAELENEELEQRTRLVRLRGDLTQEIIQNLDFQNISMKQVFILVEMVKEAKSEADIVNAEATMEQMKAEARKTEAEAEQKGYEAEQKKYKTQKTKSQLKEITGEDPDEE